MNRIWRDPNFYMINGISILIVMGVASVVPVFSKMSRALHIDLATIGLVTTVYTAPGIIVTPITGVFADRFGRKAVLVPSLIIFGVFGMLCAFADNFSLFLCFRFLQGVGVGPLTFLGLTLLGDFYEGRELTAVTGIVGGIQIAAMAAFPVIGGVLGELGWHVPFLMPVVAIPLALAILFLMKIPEPKGGADFRRHIRDALRGMKNRNMIGVFLVSFVAFVLIFGFMFTYFPIFLGHVFHASSARIGILLSFAAAFTAMASFSLGRLESWVSLKKLVVASFVLFAISLFVIPLLPSYGYMFVPCFFFGAAMGLSLPSLEVMLIRATPAEFRALYNAAFGTIMRLGQSVGPCLAGILFSIYGFSGVFVWGTGLALVPFVISLFLISGIGVMGNSGQPVRGKE